MLMVWLILEKGTWWGLKYPLSHPEQHLETVHIQVKNSWFWSPRMWMAMANKKARFCLMMKWRSGSKTDIVLRVFSEGEGDGSFCHTYLYKLGRQQKDTSCPPLLLSDLTSGLSRLSVSNGVNATAICQTACELWCCVGGEPGWCNEP